MNRIKYGSFVIDNRLNIGYVCSLACNGKLDISKKTGECIKLCKKIYEQEQKRYRGDE